jgi:hypothetical protein
MATLLITEEFIRTGLQCPPGKSKIEFCDVEQPGFRVEVLAHSPGKGTYYFSHKSEGRRKHNRLGTTSDTALKDARSTALQVRAQTRSGVVTQTEQKAPSALTVDQFFEQHYLPFVRPRKRSWKRDEELYRLRIKPAFGHKWVFRKSVTGDFGIVTGGFGNVTGHFGDVTAGPSWVT